MDTNNENAEQYVNLIDLSQDDVGGVIIELSQEASKLVWCEAHQEAFVLLMEEEVRKGNRISTTFNTIGWKNIVDGMLKNTGKKYTRDQCRQKFNTLRGEYKDFKKLLSETGVGYNCETGMIQVDDERWERCNKVMKGAKKFRRKGCKQFNKLTTIFGDTYASGSHVHPSTRAPTPTQVSTHQAAIVGGPESDYVVEDEGVDMSPSPQPPGKKPKKDSWASTMFMLMAFLKENKNNHTERIEKAILIAASSSNAGASCDKGEEVLSPSKKEKDKNNFNLCIRILTQLKGIDDLHYTKASMMLHDSEMWRDFFLSVPDARKVGWVMNI